MEFIDSPSYTFDDVALVPRHTEFGREEIHDVSTDLTRNTRLKLPFLASPMDTVSDVRMAIALGELGGMAFIHRNLPPQDQIAQVRHVKERNLAVGAAVGARPGFEPQVERLVDAGVDAIIVDSAHGHSDMVIKAVGFIANYGVDVIGGSVATKEAAEILIEAGADAIRVGMGPGAICTTRDGAGIGIGQITAIMDTVEVARQCGVGIIADGGMSKPADVVKALAAGANTVMFGRLFAGTEESPAELVMLPPDRVPSRFKSILEEERSEYAFKIYRGMGSLAAIKHGLQINAEDEFHNKPLTDKHITPEGVSGYVPYAGSIEGVVGQLVDGLKSGMFYIGAQTVDQIYKQAILRVVSSSTLSESHPHDIHVIEAGKSIFN